MEIRNLITMLAAIFVNDKRVLVRSLAIDNEVIGVPQVVCSEDAVMFTVRSRNPFTGNIYIKGKFNDPTCRQEFFSNTLNAAQLTVRIPQCGMRRIRQLQPQGMNYVLIFVVNFHSQFVTKVDRAYNVRCFYSQQEKTVTSQLEVSMIATQNLEAGTMIMPNCEYSIRSDTLNGPRIRYINIGDRLVHRWECDNPNYGMLVKNCFVNDGLGFSVRVLDGRGCPVYTPVIQGTLQYDNGLNLAYVEVWAYKFPDRPNLFYQCQIQVCNKKENECSGVTPPNCPLQPRSSFIPPTGGNVGQVPLGGGVPPLGTGVTVVRGTFPEVNGRLIGPPLVPPPLPPGGVLGAGPNLGVRPILPGELLPPVPNPYFSDSGRAAVLAEKQIAETTGVTSPINVDSNAPAPIQPRNARHRSRSAHQQPYRTIPFPAGSAPFSEPVTPFSIPVDTFGSEKRKLLAKRHAKADGSTWYHGEGVPRDARRYTTPMPKTFGDRVVHNARVDAETMDVVSDTIFVTDVTEAKEGEGLVDHGSFALTTVFKDGSKFPRQKSEPITAADSDIDNRYNGRVCINAAAFSIILLSFGLAIFIVAFLIILLLHKTDQLKFLYRCMRKTPKACDLRRIAAFFHCGRDKSSKDDNTSTTVNFDNDRRGISSARKFYY